MAAYATIPFHAWQAIPRVMPDAHMHTDMELNLLLSGGMTYFLAGQFVTLAPGDWAIFWAGMPHRMVRVAPESEYLCLTLPLAWFLAWEIGAAFTNRLLHGEMVIGVAEPLQTAQFVRWTRDLGGPDRAAMQRIVLLELEAALRRLARGSGAVVFQSGNAGGQMERIAAYLGQHYDEPLTLTDIGVAVGLNPNYLMTRFKAECGLSVWDYLTRLRVSHAQRLLLTTDGTTQRIALECGFGSVSRFFAAFRKHCGCTPRTYRQGTLRS